MRTLNLYIILNIFRVYFAYIYLLLKTEEKKKKKNRIEIVDIFHFHFIQKSRPWRASKPEEKKGFKNRFLLTLTNQNP